MRQVAVFLAVCALVFAQAMPVMAAATGEGEWVEICSESGIVLQKLELDGDDVPDVPLSSSCPDCVICASCAALDAVGTSDDALLTGTGYDRLLKRVRASQHASENPARFWPENRGPPRTTEHSSDTGALVSVKVSTQMNGGAPWT